MVRVQYSGAGQALAKEYFVISQGVMTVDGNQKTVILAPEFVTSRDVSEAEIRERIVELEAQGFDSTVVERLAYERALLELCHVGEGH